MSVIFLLRGFVIISNIWNIFSLFQMNRNIQILKGATALLVAGFITELPGIKKTKHSR